ncbi:MAG: hypothetical protein P8Z37_19725, partial [Acidobacteriota bacterium]
MKCRYSRSLITLIALITALLSISGIHAYGAALFQDEVEEEMTQEEYEAHVAQTDAYMAAINEEDPLKRGDMLLEFFDKYPEADLIESHVKPAYTVLMAECYQNQKYEALEILAEKWLKLFPGNKQTISFAATAAAQLGHNDKYLKYLLVLYNMEPNAATARVIAQLYDQQGDFEKFVEWSEICFQYPEYKVDYTLRYEILTKYADAGDVAKATEYARKTLDVLGSAEKPDAAGQKTMQTIRRECNHIIAINSYEAGKYQEAITYFDRALKIEKFQDGFYYIGQCYWKLGDPEKAHDYFAAAEILGGNITAQAKEHKEQLYKALHNDTLIGIEKVHKRAQA